MPRFKTYCDRIMTRDKHADLTNHGQNAEPLCLPPRQTFPDLLYSIRADWAGGRSGMPGTTCVLDPRARWKVFMNKASITVDYLNNIQRSPFNTCKCPFTSLYHKYIDCHEKDGAARATYRHMIRMRTWQTELRRLNPVPRDCNPTSRGRPVKTSIP